MLPKKSVNCWIITEGIAGTENQCIAVAEHLGIECSIKRIGLDGVFSYLCPHVLKAAPQWGITGIDWNEPAPDIVIASGRKAVPVVLNSFFKQSFTVFIQDPKVKPSLFDLVAVPLHDDVKGENVIYTTAAPNRVTRLKLEEAKAAMDFSHFPKNKVAVLIGGDSKAHTMSPHFAQQLYEYLLPAMRSGDYGFMVTVSRRTPDHLQEELRDIFSMPHCEFWDGQGRNPYMSYLAWADYILVTEDSTSMLSDAATTGKPVYRIGLDGGSEKFDRLYQNLKRRCMVYLFDGEMRPREYKPLRDAQKIADEIKKRFEM